MPTTPSDFYAALGRRVRDARTQAGFTQLELAERIDKSQNFLGQIERGTKHPSLDVLIALAGALQVSVADLCADHAGYERQHPDRRHGVRTKYAPAPDPYLARLASLLRDRPSHIRRLMLDLAKTLSHPPRQR